MPQPVDGQRGAQCHNGALGQLGLRPVRDPYLWSFKSPASFVFYCFFFLMVSMAYGNEGGLVLVDVVQKSVLLSMPSVELYSSADPYTRLPRSPKRPGDAPGTRFDPDDPSFRSPSDQVPVSFIKARLLEYAAYAVNS